MAKAIALMAGIRDESWGGLGCERDVDNMVEVLSSAGKYEFIILKAEQATATAVLSKIEYAAGTMVSGDLFVFYFSGHGRQKPDVNGDEDGGLDSTLCTFASEIVDDDLAARWLQFAPGVRIVMLSDCCHSGTNQDIAVMQLPQEIAPNSPMQDTRNPISFARKVPGMNAQLIHFGACRDYENSAAGSAGGAFTLTLCKIWDNGRFHGTYQQFYEAIKASLKEDKFLQEPQFNFYGDVRTAFLDSRPFSLIQQRGQNPKELKGHNT